MIDVTDCLVVRPMLRMAFIYFISVMWMYLESNKYNVLSALFMHEIDLTYISIPHIYKCFVFYASAFRRRRHYVFGLSVRPSVRPKPEKPLLTCTWVRWSTRPTVTVLRHVRPSVCLSVRPSVRLERFPGICWRTHGGNGPNFYMLMCLDHLQNW